jgi:tetratricopeptide (TPR) repeat protein
MLARAACVVGVALVSLYGVRPAQAQAALEEVHAGYRDALAHYRKGDLASAMTSLSALPDDQVRDAVRQLARRPAADGGPTLADLRTAVMLHTEKWFIRGEAGSDVVGDLHVVSARALVEAMVRRLREAPAKLSGEEGVFVRDWFLIIASYCHGHGEIGFSRAYLTEARKLFPADARLLLVTGSDHEVLSDLRAGYVQHFDADGRRTESTPVNAEKELGLAEQFLSEAARMAPDVSEARLRLGRVLYRRGDLSGAARELSAARSLTTHDAVSYLAAVFLGMVERARGEFAKAAALYGEALRIHPGGQTASLGLSEVAYLTGRAGDAAAMVATLLARPIEDEPWWGYIMGDWWHFEARLVAIRAMVQP